MCIFVKKFRLSGHWLSSFDKIKNSDGRSISSKEVVKMSSSSSVEWVHDADYKRQSYTQSDHINRMMTYFQSGVGGSCYWFPVSNTLVYFPCTVEMVMTNKPRGRETYLNITGIIGTGSPTAWFTAPRRIIKGCGQGFAHNLLRFNFVSNIALK